MIFTKAKPTTQEEKTITLADGQTFRVVVVKPTFQQRFADEGREVLAYSGRDNDAWSNYRLGRIREAVVDWRDMSGEDGKAIPFAFNRLLTVMEAYPETIDQLVAVANEAFRPLVVVPKSPAPPATSGETTGTDTESSTNSASTTASAEQNGSPDNSESQQNN